MRQNVNIYKDRAKVPIDEDDDGKSFYDNFMTLYD